MSRSTTLAAAALATAASVLTAAPATAAPYFHERYHDAGSEVLDDFCGIDGVVHTWEHRGVFGATGHGKDQIVYFVDAFHGRESFTNPATGDSYVHAYDDVVKDQTITDNGDGTLTIVVHGAGGDRWYASNGSLKLNDSGMVQWAFVVDHGGTVGDPSDDTFLEDLGIVRPSTGTNDLDGRDFCEDFFIATS